MESLEHATARNATILARVTGIAGGQSPPLHPRWWRPQRRSLVRFSHGTSDGRCGEFRTQDIDEVITSASGVHSDHAEQHAIASILGWSGAGHSHQHPRQKSLATVVRACERVMASSAVLRISQGQAQRVLAFVTGQGGQHAALVLEAKPHDTPSCGYRHGLDYPLGQDLDTVWSALISGQSGIKPTTRFDASTFPTRIAGQVADSFDWTQSVRDAEQHGNPGRHTTPAPHAAAEAWRMAGLDQSPPKPNRSGIYLGEEKALDFAATCRSHMSGVRDEAYDWPTWGKTAQQAYSREFEAEQEPLLPPATWPWSTTCGTNVQLPDRCARREPSPSVKRPI